MTDMIRTTSDNITCFEFPPEVTLESIIDGTDILDWMDEHICRSAFITISLVELSRTDNGGYRFIYEVAPRRGINPEYMYRHLAFKHMANCLMN